MKYLLVVGDGMADYPIPELGNKTPLQAAYKPNMDAIAAKGRSGLIKTRARRVKSRFRRRHMLSARLRPKNYTARAEDPWKRLQEA